MLADDYNDILCKSLHAQQLTIADLAPATGLSTAILEDYFAGTHSFDAATPMTQLDDLQRIANALGLDGEKFIRLRDYSPKKPLPPEVHQCTTPFRDFDVNAYMITLPNEQLIFDTGTDTAPLLAKLDPYKPTHLFITHEHVDHCGKRNELCQQRELSHHARKDLAPLSIDGISITPLDVAGHCTPATAYFLEGLSAPVCIVGDAIFAGSIGKCPDPASYATARQNIREQLFTLPAQTILCPGHGPCSTVHHELIANPFF